MSVTIKTEYNTYTAKMPAEESEKLFRKFLMEIIGMDRVEPPKAKKEQGCQQKHGVTKKLPGEDVPVEDIPEDKAASPVPQGEGTKHIQEACDPVMEPEPISKSYKGFLHIKCQECGKVKSFCAREPVSEYKCSCGQKTPLGDLADMNVDCECGRHSHYRTNMEEFLFDAECIKCGSPVTVKWNKKKKMYETVA